MSKTSRPVQNKLRIVKCVLTLTGSMSLSRSQPQQLSSPSAKWKEYLPPHKVPREASVAHELTDVECWESYKAS